MENPHNILIIRFSSIGDVLLATPLIRILRKKFPNASIDFIVRREYAELLQHNPYLSHLIVFDSSEGFKSLRKLKNELKHASYDIVLDIHNSIRSRYLRKCLRVPVRTIHKRILQRFLLIHCKWNFYNGIVPVAERYLETASCFGIENDGKGLDLFLPQEINARVET
nr:glycosyltransferase family 9 protein [Bacteroidota bacterium]